MYGAALLTILLYYFLFENLAPTEEVNRISADILETVKH